MHQMLQRLLFCILFYTWFYQLQAQKVDSIMKIYGEQFQQEKIYLHFDKAIYGPGETVWYKAYLLAGTEPTTFSTNFYLDWYDADGKLLKHTTAPLIESTAKGQFDIPADYNKGALHIKGYTQWMLNFDADFMYDKNIPVIQSTSISTGMINTKTTVDFFPEGGDLVIGLLSRVAFKAIDPAGMPVKIAGVIKNNKGEPLDSFASEHDGMGSFSIEPQPGESYTAEWIDALGKTGNSMLPVARKTGIVLQVKPFATRELIIIKRTLDLPPELKTLHVLAHMNQHPVFSALVDLSSKNSITSQIPIGSLPTGVLQITLFNANWIPVAERIVFINNNEYQFETTINLAEKNLGKRGKNIMEISISDSTISNLSVSVTDAGISHTTENIFSQLLLCSDLKGYVHNPAYYFSGDDDELDAHLDLVMLTHGWRRYKWDEIVKGKLPAILFPKDTGYISLQGKLLNSSSLKITKGQQIFLLLSGKDSSQQMFGSAIKADGQFNQEGVRFFDSVKLMYRFTNDQKLTDKAELSVRTNLLTKPAVYWDMAKEKNLLPIESTAYLQNLFFVNEQAKINKLAKDNLLPEVTVKQRMKKPIDVLDDQYTSTMFKDAGYQFDTRNDPKLLDGSVDLFQYLQAKIPGMQIVKDSKDPVGGDQYALWRGAKADVYLDEVYQDLNATKTISMKDIAYLKVISPGSGAGMHGGGSRGGVIALYSKRGDDFITNDLSSKIIMLEGYTPFKEFYSPQYTNPNNDVMSDARTTIYWNPSVLLDAQTLKVKLSFYNNDYSKKLRIVLEGMNAEGRLTRVEKVIE
jgi:hypothetical protein